MKTKIIPLIMFALFYSCGSNLNEVPEVGGLILPASNSVVIVDAEFNDRLNPESPSYFGKEYIEGIEFFVLKDGKKLPYHNYPDRSIIRPPLRWSEEYGYMNTDNTRGYYFMFLMGHCFIKYPDGSEDELRVQYKDLTTVATILEKVWINDELAFESRRAMGEGFYYNPKYFPWMRPVLNDDGIQTGEMPDIGNGGNRIFVLTK